MLKLFDKPMVYLKIASVRDSLRYRRSEWGLAFIMVMWGLTVSGPHPSLASPSWQPMLAWADENTWGAFATVLGFGRLTVLYVNGRWRRSAHLRMVSAFLSCFFWSSVWWGLWTSELYPPGLAVYSGFLFMDFHTIYEAGVEARKTDEKYYAG